MAHFHDCVNYKSQFTLQKHTVQIPLPFQLLLTHGKRGCPPSSDTSLGKHGTGPEADLLFPGASAQAPAKVSSAYSATIVHLSPVVPSVLPICLPLLLGMPFAMFPEDVLVTATAVLLAAWGGKGLLPSQLHVTVHQKQ